MVVAALPVLGCLDGLRVLDLRLGPALGDACANALVSTLQRMRNLQNLCLVLSTQIGDPGATALSTLTTILPELRDISLGTGPDSTKETVCFHYIWSVWTCRKLHFGCGSECPYDLRGAFFFFLFFDSMLGLLKILSGLLFQGCILLRSLVLDLSDNPFGTQALLILAEALTVHGRFLENINLWFPDPKGHGTLDAQQAQDHQHCHAFRTLSNAIAHGCLNIQHIVLRGFTCESHHHSSQHDELPPHPLRCLSQCRTLELDLFGSSVIHIDDWTLIGAATTALQTLVIQIEGIHINASAALGLSQFICGATFRVSFVV